MNDSTCGQQENALTAEYVRSILDYDPDTGVLTWRYRPDMRPQWNTRFAGKRAGSEYRKKGERTAYRRIRIDGRTYGEHRLAFLHYYGHWPRDQIDHVNGDGADNRIANLREVDNKENGRNQRKRLNNTSGVTGVYWHKRDAKWIALIQVNGRFIYLGYFDDLEDAKRARLAAELKYGFTSRHGRGE